MRCDLPPGAARIVEPWARDLMSGAVYRDLPAGNGRVYIRRGDGQAARKAQVDADLRAADWLVVDAPPGCLIENPVEPAADAAAPVTQRVFREG